MSRAGESHESMIAYLNLSPARVTGLLVLPTIGATASLAAAWRRTGEVSLPPAVSRLGAIAAVAGAGLTAAGMSQFSTKQIASAELGNLIGSGVYQFTRNPQYTGYTLSLAGLAVARRSSVAALLGAGVVGYFRYWISLEESYLNDKLGKDYRAYQRRTHRWLGPSK